MRFVPIHVASTRHVDSIRLNSIRLNSIRLNSIRLNSIRVNSSRFEGSNETGVGCLSGRAAISNERSTARFQPRDSTPTEGERKRSGRSRTATPTTAFHQQTGTATGGMQPTAGPTTRRGGLTAGSGENDAGNKDAGKNDAGNNDAGKNDAGKNDAGNNDAGKNDAGNNDALPTDAGKNDHHLDSTQAAVLLSTVRAASEEEKSPFEASMLQQYQKAMMMQIHAQMAMGGLLPNPLLGLANPLLSSALKMPSGTSNAFYPSREPTPARRQLSGPVKGAVRKASQQARGRRAYSTSVLDRDVLDEFIPGTADEEELKKRRRKESNRESARRSRLRKQAECDSLQGEIAVLRNEVGLLRKENTELRNLVTTLRGTEEKGEPRV